MNNKIFKISSETKKLFADFLDGDFFGLAAEVSFYLLSTFFPMAILAFTVASSISLNYSDIMIKAISALPDKAARLVIKMLLSKGRSNTVILITAFLSMTTMSGFILTIEKGLNRFYKTETKRKALKSRALAAVFAFFIFMSVIASFGLVIFGKVISNYIYGKTQNLRILWIWNISRYAFIFLFISLVISALYMALPTVKLKIKEVLPGAASATVAWFVASMLFALYVNNFPQYEIIYGSLAGLVCMIVWVYITGIVILAGAKINALLYIRKNNRGNKAKRRRLRFLRRKKQK